MKVNNSQKPNAQSVNTQKTGTASSTNTNQKSGAKGPLDFATLGDSSRIDFSSRAQEAKKAKEIAKNVPDVDEAKVAKFQALIDSGKYKVDSSAVAERMIAEDIKNMAGEE